MITVPERLLQADFVTILLQSTQATLLRKELDKSTGGRQSYVSQHVIIAVKKGEQQIQTDEGEVITIKAGQMATLRRGLYTVTDLVAQNNRFEAYLVFFEPELLEGVQLNPASSLKPTEPWRKILAHPAIDFFWQSLPSWLSTVPSSSAALQEIKIREYFALLSASGAASDIAQLVSSNQRASSQNLRQFMEKHFDKPLSVADYAYLTGRSESTFRREFKVKFGTTPRQWLIRKRLEKAHSLLQASQSDVTQTAFAVGYDNVSHFISEYKKQYGYTPKQRPSLTSTAIH